MGKGFLTYATATILQAIANGYLYGFDIIDMWKSGERIFLFTEDSKKEFLLNMMGSPVFVAAQRGGKSLLMNKP